jgi:hypothetical protein
MNRQGEAVSRSKLPTVSAVIPTYRRASRIEPCVRALLADPATTEVVVAIDGSGDGSYEIATRLAERDSRVVAFEQPHAGTHAAHTAAVKKATSEVVLMVDDDVIASDSLVTGHALHHREADHLVVLGYMPVVVADTTPGIRSLARIYSQEYEKHCAELEADQRLVLLHLWGGNVSLRRADYLSIGFLPTGDEPWKVEHEDQYLGIRFHEAGLTGVFDRSLYAEHRYERDIGGFLRSARTRGMAKWQLHTMFPELLGTLDPDWASVGLPHPTGWIVRKIAASGLCHSAVEALVMTARAAHTVRLDAAESASYRFARRVELQAGTRSAADSPGPTADPGSQPGVTLPGVESA